ncbi:hypothetical protein J1N35_027368 [Gossypium stocksii]|uniref:RNase H type-1 domain-containing protein n=1 Tax=Gossypium stocksii TaxID=47602 RepID=A0A9D3VAM7_9ROSI|nr:hypothetical protein J1N35_027368 [Gossypium stocksii]
MGVASVNWLSFDVESRVLLGGLKSAWTKGYHQVEIESDNVILISVVQNGLTSSIYSEVQLMHDWCFKD